jgi:hypothetical protein
MPATQYPNATQFALVCPSIRRYRVPSTVAPEPEGRMEVAGDLCVARRQRCALTSPPPRALSSPPKPHARNAS